MCSSLRLTWASARSRWPIEPGSCMPVSTRTMPSPAASAQALQCGTPGQGSGSRILHTPGSTRSPRPTSRLRLASGTRSSLVTCGDLDSPPMSPTPGRLRARPRLARLMAAPPEPIAEGVWVVRGGFPARTMNVYLVRDGDGVLCFDAGIKDMTAAVAAAARELGGLTRIVLGHGHP